MPPTLSRSGPLRQPARSPGRTALSSIPPGIRGGSLPSLGLGDVDLALRRHATPGEFLLGGFGSIGPLSHQALLIPPVTSSRISGYGQGSPLRPERVLPPHRRGRLVSTQHVVGPAPQDHALCACACPRLLLQTSTLLQTLQPLLTLPTFASSLPWDRSSCYAFL